MHSLSLFFGLSSLLSTFLAFPTETEHHVPTSGHREDIAYTNWLGNDYNSYLNLEEMELSMTVTTAAPNDVPGSILDRNGMFDACPNGVVPRQDAPQEINYFNPSVIPNTQDESIRGTEREPEPEHETIVWMREIAKRLLEQEKREERELKRQRLQANELQSEPSEPIDDQQAGLQNLALLQSLWMQTNFSEIMKKYGYIQYLNGRDLQSNDAWNIYEKHFMGSSILDIVLSQKIEGDNVIKIIRAFNEYFVEKGMITPQGYPDVYRSFHQFATETNTFKDRIRLVLENLTSIAFIPRLGSRSKRREPLSLEEAKTIFQLYIRDNDASSIAQAFNIGVKMVKSVVNHVAAELRDLHQRQVISVIF